MRSVSGRVSPAAALPDAPAAATCSSAPRLPLRPPFVKPPKRMVEKRTADQVGSEEWGALRGARCHAAFWFSRAGSRLRPFRQTFGGDVASWNDHFPDSLPAYGATSPFPVRSPNPPAGLGLALLEIVLPLRDSLQIFVCLASSAGA